MHTSKYASVLYSVCHTLDFIFVHIVVAVVVFRCSDACLCIYYVLFILCLFHSLSICHDHKKNLQCHKQPKSKTLTTDRTNQQSTNINKNNNDILYSSVKFSMVTILKFYGPFQFLTIQNNKLSLYILWKVNRTENRQNINKNRKQIETYFFFLKW